MIRSALYTFRKESMWKNPGRLRIRRISLNAINAETIWLPCTSTFDHFSMYVVWIHNNFSLSHIFHCVTMIPFFVPFQSISIVECVCVCMSMYSIAIEFPSTMIVWFLLRFNIIRQLNHPLIHTRKAPLTESTWEHTSQYSIFALSYNQKNRDRMILSTKVIPIVLNELRAWEREREGENIKITKKGKKLQRQVSRLQIKFEAIFCISFTF